MTLTFKERLLPVKLGEGYESVVNETRTSGGILIKREVLPLRYRPLRTITGNQKTGSESHQWNRRRKAKGLTDIGGEFSSVKRTVEAIPANIGLKASIGSPLSGNYSEVAYKGSCLPWGQIGTGSYSFPSLVRSSPSQLDELGAIAVSAASPTTSAANLGTFLGEMFREGIPNLMLSSWKKVTGAGREFGDDYLNAQFGWAPIIGEIKDFFNAARHADELFAQLERDAGRVVRRRWDFPLKVEDTVHTFPTSDWPEIGSQNTGYYNSPSSWTITRVRETSTRQWFSGAFTYYLPTGYDSRKVMDRWELMADKIFGISLTPEVLWSLSPWSWAADWFSNMGEVMSNLSDRISDGLVMRYGYLMEHTIVKDTYTRSPSPFKNGSPTGVLILKTESKVRRRANPFGFGVSWDGLSPYQLSIAAALGISRT